MKYRITDKCVGCGACVDACKYDAIPLSDQYYINPEKCIGCGDCEETCPAAAIIGIPNMAMFFGDKMAKNLYVGNKPVRAVYAGSKKIWPNVVRVEQGAEYGEWAYDDPVRRRTVTPWEQDVYSDGSVGERRTGTPYTQEETAAVSYTYGAWSYNDPTRSRSKTTVYTYSDVTRNGVTVKESQTAATSVDWDGSTYWNGSCGTNYYYVDYKKVRTRYTYSDVVRYSDYYNGDSRSRRIDGQCGWVREWRDTSDWYITGSTCNAAGVNGAYDCDGTYSITYWNEGKDQSYCYPDMSGSTQTRTIWRVGPIAERKQVDGQCGYQSTHQELRPYYEWQDERGDSLGNITSSEYISDKVYIIDTGLSYASDGDDLILMFYRIELVTVDSTGSVLGTDDELKYDDLQFSFDESYKYNCDVDVYRTNSEYEYYIAFHKNDTQVQMQWDGDIWITDKNTGAKIKIMLGLLN